MKILVVLLVIALLFGAFLFFNKKNNTKVTVLHHGPFTVKMEVSSHRKLTSDYKFATETNVAYSVWYNNKVIMYPSPLQGNTGYSHLWRVYVLEGAPKPTLIAGSQSLFMINEDAGKAVVTPLDAQIDDFASLQFLDSANAQPGKVMNVYMAHGPENIDTLKGGEYLLVNQRLILHVPDLKMQSFNNLEQIIDGNNFLKVGGAVGFSPDKKSLVFMGGKYDDKMKYHYAMIIHNPFDEKTYVLPYDRTQTRSVDLNYENREWFHTYFEWIKDNQGFYQLQLRKFKVLPSWEGSFEDYDKVYHLTPVKNEIQQVFADFILKELDLKKEDIHPGPQYSSNMMVIYYKNYKFDVWLRPEDSIVVLMMADPYVPEAIEGIKIIHQLGDRFNKELKSGKYQEYFTQIKD